MTSVSEAKALVEELRQRGGTNLLTDAAALIEDQSERLSRYESALRFYQADKCDGGDRARAALEDK